MVELFRQVDLSLLDVDNFEKVCASFIEIQRAGEDYCRLDNGWDAEKCSGLWPPFGDGYLPFGMKWNRVPVIYANKSGSSNGL
jgi:hypothetical protein